jgi:hypothetical protein
MQFFKCAHTYTNLCACVSVCMLARVHICMCLCRLCVFVRVRECVCLGVSVSAHVFDPDMPESLSLSVLCVARRFVDDTASALDRVLELPGMHAHIHACMHACIS